MNEKRQGEICNACVLLVKRWSKLPQGSTKNWKHVSTDVKRVEEELLNEVLWLRALLSITRCILLKFLRIQFNL